MEPQRRVAMFTTPITLKEYADTIIDDRFKYLFSSPDDQCLFNAYIRSLPDVGEAVVFISPVLKNLLASAEEIHVDVTCKRRPTWPKTKQFLVIMAMYMDRAFPIVYVLMTRKNAYAYFEVLTYVKQEICNMQVKNIVSGNELELIIALREVFPGANQQIFWFHMAQALEKNAIKFGIKREVNANDTHLHETVNMAKALALLPPDRVGEGFEIVKRVANLSPNQNLIQRFLTYFETQWIDCIGANIFSVYGRPRRTNDDCDVFHRILDNMRGDRPDIWTFTIDGLMKIDNIYTSQYNTLLSWPVLRPQGRKYIQQDRRIKLETEKFNAGQITMIEFLVYAGHVEFNPELLEPGQHHQAVDTEDIFNLYDDEEDMGSEDERPEDMAELINGQRNVQRNVQQNMEEVQANQDGFIGNDGDFILPEDLDDNHIMIANDEAEMLAEERQNIPQVTLDMAGVTRRLPKSCVICLSNRSTHAFIPCGHQCLCQECALIIAGDKCPVCNTDTTSINRIFII